MLIRPSDAFANAYGVIRRASRDLSGMRLLAIWCALALLVGDPLAPAAREVLVAPFRGMLGSQP
jgi:hypothetical protein